MRRVDRAVTDQQEILAILKACTVCRLGMVQNQVPYVVPLNFGFDYADGKLTLFFHCANEGKKIDILKENPLVCFEMECGAEVVAKEKACSFSMKFRSIIGTGRVEFLSEDADKQHGLQMLMKQIDHTGKTANAEFTGGQLRGVTVLKLPVDTFEAKCAK